MIKKFNDFINEEYESHYRLKDSYLNDPVFRYHVDDCTLIASPEGNPEKTHLVDGECFYGKLVFHPSKNSLSKVEFTCLTDNPKHINCMADSKMLFNAFHIYTKKFENPDRPFDKDDWDGWASRPKGKNDPDLYVWSKVSCEEKSLGNLQIKKILKIYKNSEACENDMIKTLKKSED